MRNVYLQNTPLTLCCGVTLRVGDMSFLAALREQYRDKILVRTLQNSVILR